MTSVARMPAGVSRSPVEIPELETVRLRLRGFRPDDTAVFVDAMTKPAAMRGEPSLAARVSAWRLLSMVFGSWLLEGHGYWVVEEKATGAVVGRIGSFVPRGWPDFEVGWEIFEPYRLQGLATEGVCAALEWFRAARGIDTFTFRISSDNIASRKLARSVGAVLPKSAAPVDAKAETWVASWEAFTSSVARARYCGESSR